MLVIMFSKNINITTRKKSVQCDIMTLTARE